MKVTGKKGNRQFSYDGKKGLEAEMQEARGKLEEKQNAQERVFLLWQLQKAKKAHEAYEQRIADLKEFIRLAERELERQREGKGGENA